MLEDDVAIKSIRYHHLIIPGEDIAGFAVAHEIVAGLLLHQFIGFLGELIALFRLCADVDQAHAGIGNIHHALHIDGAHQAELQQILGLAIHIGAGIDEHEIALQARQHGRKGGAFDARDAADFEHAARQQRAGAARGNHGARAAFAHGVHGDHQGGILLGAHRHHGRFVHADHLGGVFNENAVFYIACGCGQLLQLFLRTHQHDLDILEFAQRADCALHDGVRRIVAAHGVQGDYIMAHLHKPPIFYIFRIILSEK